MSLYMSDVMAQTISVALLVFLGFESCLECERSVNLFCFGIFIWVPGKGPFSCELAWILGGGT